MPKKCCFLDKFFKIASALGAVA